MFVTNIGQLLHVVERWMAGNQDEMNGLACTGTEFLLIWVCVRDWCVAPLLGL